MKPLRNPPLVFLVAMVLWATHASPAPLPIGHSKRDLVINDTSLTIYCFKPERYRNGALLVSFHGLSRDIPRYLEASKPIAERNGLLLVLPVFDRARFPYWRYQGLGITRQNRRVTSGPIPVEPPATWTSVLVNGIVDEIRRVELKPTLDYYLIGHSAGGQIANRLAAFASMAAKRIVVSNPSSYVVPSRDARFPYGFGALPPSIANNETLRRYLAQPMTIFAGQEDVLDENLDMRAAAMAQGATRYDRARNVFRLAKAIANERGWTFNWTLVEVPGVGHDVTRMYGSPQVDFALFGQH